MNCLKNHENSVLFQLQETLKPCCWKPLQFIMMAPYVSSGNDRRGHDKVAEGWANNGKYRVGSYPHPGKLNVDFFGGKLMDRGKSLQHVFTSRKLLLLHPLALLLNPVSIDVSLTCDYRKFYIYKERETSSCQNNCIC
ncbi:unnamed protein product [Allacma fusca]|uniref:Uncharacterized protein n=1 Tax=Allacma fusca TaxID=39272 RepID=A0A8J2KER6_9HEXA|nr:unnamed protein product [Allacma fusca]